MSKTSTPPTARAEPKSKSLQFPPDPLRLRVNHPKNYLAYLLATQLEGPTGLLVDEHITSMVGAVRDGARQLGLIDLNGFPTEAGDQLINEIIAAYGNPESAFTSLVTLSNSRTRFINSGPLMAALLRVIVIHHPFISSLTRTLQNADEPLTLPTLTKKLYQHSPKITRIHLIRSHGPHSEYLLKTPTQEDSPLFDTETYASSITYQLKSALCHLGILATPGVDTSRLTPAEQIWQLDPNSFRREL